MAPLLLELWSTADGLYTMAFSAAPGLDSALGEVLFLACLFTALEGFRDDLFIVERQFPNSHLGGTSWVEPD